jgi:hypothetical protein
VRGDTPPVRHRKRAVSVLTATLLVANAGVALAQDALQFQVAPGSLVINSAVAGSAPTAKSTSTGRYRVRVASGTRRISASINSPLPSGVTLTITLVAPSGATSVGPVTLSTTPQTVVTNVTNTSFSPNLGITYTLTATTAAGVIASANKTVTLSLTP